jgi:hypothetical protein
MLVRMIVCVNSHTTSHTNHPWTGRNSQGKNVVVNWKKKDSVTNARSQHILYQSHTSPPPFELHFIYHGTGSLMFTPPPTPLFHTLSLMSSWWIFFSPEIVFFSFHSSSKMKRSRLPDGEMAEREPFVLGNSKKPMFALPPRKCRATHGRSQKGCSFIHMIWIHPCIQNGTLSLWNRAFGTVKVFSCFMASSEVFWGYSSVQSPEKGAL